MIITKVLTPYSNHHHIDTKQKKNIDSRYILNASSTRYTAITASNYSDFNRERIYWKNVFPILILMGISIMRALNHDGRELKVGLN